MFSGVYMLLVVGLLPASCECVSHDGKAQWSFTQKLDRSPLLIAALFAATDWGQRSWLP